jgi:hypothetical protein
VTDRESEQTWSVCWYVSSVPSLVVRIDR